MIERYQDADLVVERDDLEDTIKVKIVSGSDTEKLCIDIAIISYGPEIYRRWADMLLRAAKDIEDSTEYAEFLEEGDDDD